jgi:subtilisin family serine protease
MGYTGRGVTVVVLDDGLEITHTDIRNNYVRRIFISNRFLNSEIIVTNFFSF